MLEVIALICVIMLFIIGIVGIIAPVIPSLPLIFLGVLGYGWATQFEKISLSLIITLGLMALVGTLLDFIVNALGAKKMGASRYGIIGAVLGSIIGIAFGPVGIIGGAFIGALICEFLFQKDAARALRAGLGTFIGFLFGTLLKIVLVIVMIGLFIAAVI